MGRTEKKDNEGKGSFDREKYRLLFENSVTATFIGKPDGTILDANSAACNLFGYSIEEFRALGRQGVIDPDSPGLKDRLKKRQETGKTKGELIGIRKGGDRFWCQFSSSVFTDSKGEKMSATMIVDISDRKSTEERLSSVTNNVPGVVFRYILHPDGKDELQHVSNGAWKVWGVEPAEAMKNNEIIWSRFHEDDREAVFQSAVDSAKTFSAWFKEWRYHHPEKGVCWHRGMGNPVRLNDGSTAWDSIILDVTEEVDSKQKLAFKEKQLSLTFDTISELIFTIETEDRKNFFFTSVNKQFLKNLGSTKDEILGNNIENILPKETVAVVKKKYVEVIEKRENLQWEETIELNKGFKTGIVSVTPVFEEGSENIQLIGSVSDITERKAAEDALQKVMDQSLDVICTIDEDGRFVRVSQASISLWGYKPVEIVGKAYLDMVHPDDYDKTIQVSEKIMSGVAVTNFENRYIRKDGSAVDVIWSARWDKDDSLMYCVAKDATELNRAKLEKELLINNTEESFILLNKELKIVSFNDQFSRLYNTHFGVSVEKGDFILNYAQPERKEIVSDIYKRVLKGEREESTISIRQTNGLEKIYSIRFKPVKGDYSKIIGVFVTIVDVTEEINTKKQLEESNERYEYVTKATSDAIWDFVPKTGNLFWGEGFKTLFGYEKERNEPGIEKWLSHIHPNDIERIEEGVGKLLSGNETVWDEEYRFKKADGTYAFVRDKAIVIRNEEGKTERVVGAMEDITERKQKEQQLKLMESVVTNTSDAVIITKAEPIEAPNGPEIVYVNEAFETMTGYKAEEVIGKTPRMLTGPNSDHKGFAEFEKKLKRWKPAEMETINYKKNGEEFWVQFSMSPVTNDKGWYTHWIAVERDITERKNRELEQQLLSQISIIFNEANSVKTALEKSLVVLKDFGDFYLSEIWLVNHNGTSIDRISWIEKEAESFYQRTSDINSFVLGEGLPGKTWETGDVQFWKNLGTRKSFIRKDAAKKVGLKTAYGFPIECNNEITGALTLGVQSRPKNPHYFAPILKGIAVYLGEEIERKRLEEELSRIFSSAPDIISVAGFDGYYQKVNPAMSELLGYTEEELLSIPILHFVHPDDREKTEKQFSLKKKGEGNQYFENRYITKSGKVIWLSWTSKPFYDEGVSYSVAKNVTEQKELEELLDQANKLAKIGSWEVDLLEKTVYWSEIARQIHEEATGFTPSLENGLAYFKEGEAREKISDAIECAIKNGEGWDLELPIITAKGNEKWVRTIGAGEMVEGNCIRLYGSLQDIHDRKELENLLHQTTRLAKVGSWELNVKEGEMYWSPMTREILGVNDDYKAKASSITEFCREEDQNFIQQTIGHALKSGNPFDIELPITSQNQENKWVRCIGHADMLKGVPVRLIGSLQDITQRKEAELAFKQASKERINLLESISDAFYAIDKNWEITYFNKEAEKVLETPAELVLGNRIWDEFSQAANTELFDCYKKVMEEKEPASFEYFYPPQQSWYEISAYPAEDGISVFFRNINDKKRAQNQILQKTRQLDAIAMFNSLLIQEENWLTVLDKCLEKFGKVIGAHRVYYFDRDLDNPDGTESTSMKIEWVEEGIHPEINNPENQNLTISDISHFANLITEKSVFNEVISNLKDENFKTYLRKQGIKSMLAVPVFTDQRFRGFIGFDDCKTERLWSKEEISFLQTISINLASAIENDDSQVALKKAYEEKNNILESIGDGFFALHSDWTVTYWNSQAEQLLSTKKETVLGRYLWDVFDKDLAPESYKNYKIVLQEQVAVHFEDFYQPIQRWFDVSAYPSESGISVFFKDISERKESQQKLQELNRSLEKQTNELAVSNAELEQFAFVASHDLQEPLRMITSFLAQLEKKYNDVLDEKGRQYIHFATDGAKRMRQIILDLLDYSRVGRVDTEKEQVNVDDLMNNVVSLHRKVIEEKKAQIIWKNLPAVYAAKGPLQQVFHNLVHNALHYQKPDVQPVIQVKGEGSGSHWSFSVIDNGIGINPNYTEKIFNIFQRLHGKEEYSGTGVGLAICKKIIEDHGGKIGVESEEGLGSTFYFTIPKNEIGE